MRKSTQETIPGTVTLTNGVKLVGEIVHINPNYTVIIVEGKERYVPAHLIKAV